MSAADLNVPGFYGKMPATGDFVTRRLPGDFVRVWDRWLAQHIVPLLGTEAWPESTALRFLAGPTSFGTSAGIVLQSADRIGRRFPLSVVARLSDAALTALPVPPVEPVGDTIDDLVMWTARTDIFDVDPQAPQPMLEQIFAASWETS